MSCAYTDEVSLISGLDLCLICNICGGQILSRLFVCARRPDRNDGDLQDPLAIETTTSSMYYMSCIRMHNIRLYTR